MQIVPIRDLRNTNEISERCRQSAEPIFVTKNGYGDMVIMSMETYERTVAMAEVYRKLMQAEAEMDAGKAIDGEAAFCRVEGEVQLKDVPIQTDAIRRPGSAGNRGLYCGAVERAGECDPAAEKSGGSDPVSLCFSAIPSAGKR